MGTSDGDVIVSAPGSNFSDPFGYHVNEHNVIAATPGVYVKSAVDRDKIQINCVASPASVDEKIVSLHPEQLYCVFSPAGHDFDAFSTKAVDRADCVYSVLVGK